MTPNHLIDLVDDLPLFTSGENRPFTRLPTAESVPLHSAAFRNWLLGEFEAEHGEIPAPQAFRAAVHQLEARAARNSAARTPVARRIGSRRQTIVPESLVIDLADSCGSVVDITPQGWSVTPNPGVLFESSTAAAPMPAPIPSGGDALDALRDCLNLASRADWLRCLTWILAAFRPNGPYPVLILQGPAGSGKTTAARLLRTLVDPAAAPLAAPPGSVRDLVGFARRHWLLAFDRVPGLGPNLTDAICRLTSGMGISSHEEVRRRDAQPFEQTIERPILFTVTDRWTCPPDLAHRALVVNLQPIPPDRLRAETEILDTFLKHLPAIFGALCTVLSAALRDAARLTGPAAGPHCPDALAWAIAASPALHVTPEELRDACIPPPPHYPLVDAILALLDVQSAWTGTATELQQQLQFDLSPQHISRQLSAHTQILSTQKIQVKFHRIHGGARRIDLSRTPGDDKPATCDTPATIIPTATYAEGDAPAPTPSSPPCGAGLQPALSRLIATQVGPERRLERLAPSPRPVDITYEPCRK